MNTPVFPRPTASEDEIRLDRLRRRRRSYPLWRLVRANIRDIFLISRQAWIALFLLALLLFGSALYLQRSNGTLDFAEALYTTLLLLVFESGPAFPSDWLGRLIFFAVPLFGLAFLLQSVVDFTRLVFNKDARRDDWQISLASTFSEHIVVCGVGRVGYRAVLQLLDAGYDVVAVDNDRTSEFAATVLRLKVPLVVGDARDPDVLRHAGVLRCRGLIAVINDDLKNIEIALSARRLRPDLQTVMRIFNRELDVNLERRFGRNSAFSSSALGAPTFAAAAVSREIVHVLYLHEGLVGLTEITLVAESALAGRAHEVEERFKVRLIRLRDGAGNERPRGFLGRLKAGDIALFLGTLEALESVRMANLAALQGSGPAKAPMQRPNEHFNTVIVCGLGKVGSAVIRLLMRMEMEPRPALVVICTADTPQEQTAMLESQGVRVIRGDARERRVLEQAGVRRAYAVAAVFGDDLTNLQIGLAARELRPDIHLVLRVFSDVLAERLGALFGIHTAYSTSSLAAPTLAAAAVLREVDHAFDVGERLFATETRPLAVGDRCAGQSVAELRTQTDLLTVALRRQGVAELLPSSDTRLEPGDELVLLGDLHDLARLRARHGS